MAGPGANRFVDGAFYDRSVGLPLVVSVLIRRAYFGRGDEIESAFTPARVQNPKGSAGNPHGWTSACRDTSLNGVVRRVRKGSDEGAVTQRGARCFRSALAGTCGDGL